MKYFVNEKILKFKFQGLYIEIRQILQTLLNTLYSFLFKWRDIMFLKGRWLCNSKRTKVSFKHFLVVSHTKPSAQHIITVWVADEQPWPWAFCFILLIWVQWTSEHLWCLISVFSRKYLSMCWRRVLCLMMWCPLRRGCVLASTSLRTAWWGSWRQQPWSSLWWDVCIRHSVGQDI